MRRVVVISVLATTCALAILGELDAFSEVLAWELLLLTLLAVLVRLLPSNQLEEAPPIIRLRPIGAKAPREFTSPFELAATRAASEEPGADRRLRQQLRTIAQHRLRRAGAEPGSPRASDLVDPVVFSEDSQPLSSSQIDRIVGQLERL